MATTTPSRFMFGILTSCAAMLCAANALAAQTLTSGEFQAAKAHAEEEYKSARQSCDPLDGNAEDVCVAQAKAQRDTAKAKAEARYKNTAKAHYQARVTEAEGEYNVAKQKCDGLDGNEKDVCVKQAKAKLVKAKADAKVARESAGSGKEAREDAAEAREEAAEDKREAEYKVAREKCDAYDGDAKDQCVASVKQRFGKS